MSAHLAFESAGCAIGFLWQQAPILDGSAVTLRGSGTAFGIFATNAQARQAGHQRFGLTYFVTKEVLRCDLVPEQYSAECRA
jgi:hypothetical protein